jgi:hypothetical protein
MQAGPRGSMFIVGHSASSLAGLNAVAVARVRTAKVTLLGRCFTRLFDDIDDGIRMGNHWNMTGIDFDSRRPHAFAMKRSCSVFIVPSFSATRYQLGLFFQAGTSTFASNNAAFAGP